MSSTSAAVDENNNGNCSVVIEDCSHKIDKYKINLTHAPDIDFQVNRLKFGSENISGPEVKICSSEGIHTLPDQSDEESLSLYHSTEDSIVDLNGSFSAMSTKASDYKTNGKKTSKKYTSKELCRFVQVNKKITQSNENTPYSKMSTKQQIVLPGSGESYTGKNVEVYVSPEEACGGKPIMKIDININEVNQMEVDRKIVAEELKEHNIDPCSPSGMQTKKVLKVHSEKRAIPQPFIPPRSQNTVEKKRKDGDERKSYSLRSRQSDLADIKGTGKLTHC